MTAAGVVGVLVTGGGLILARHAGAGSGHGAWCPAEGQGACGHERWGGHGFGHGRFRGDHDHDPEEVRERIGFVSDRILGYLDASEAQREAIDEILDRSVAETFASLGQRGEVHEQLSALLASPEVDRAALESLRAQQIALADTLSRELTTTLADIADVLTPEQRSDLAELHERFRR
jgi:Spy/CpxP family protein refolding chaperone